MYKLLQEENNFLDGFTGVAKIKWHTRRMGKGFSICVCLSHSKCDKIPTQCLSLAALLAT